MASSSCLILTSVLGGFVNGLKANGATIEKDLEAGTLVAKEGDTVVLRAIQKSRNGPWIAMFTDGDCIRWTHRGSKPV